MTAKPPAGHPTLILEDYSFWFKPSAGQPEGAAALTGVSFSIEAEIGRAHV